MMKKQKLYLFAIMTIFLLPGSLRGQEEVASRYYHYRSTEMSTGLYEEYEVRPRGIHGLFENDRERQRGSGISRLDESDPRAWNRIFLNDAHRGIAFYEYRRCVDCHQRNAQNRHTVRYGITCRQCHGGEPIASINHYFSRLNPIRQHTHICSKCHAGAKASFALYVVHEPNPARTSTIESIPVLFYAFWLMVAIAVLTFALFIPHTIMWIAREIFLQEKHKGKNEYEIK
jgi:hypothetical protein